MAKQTGVGAVLLAEAQRHFRVGDIVNLVGSRAEGQCIHDGRHVAGYTAASLGGGGMMGVLRGLRDVEELGVTAGAHAIRLIFEFQGSLVGGEIVAVGVMTVPTTHLSFAEAL